MAKQFALGKGLGALISDADAQASRSARSASPSADSEGLSSVPLANIEVNPFQPRKDFDQEELEKLADSMRSYGLIQPITLRLTESGKYQIISGERRFKAAQMAGLTQLPAYIRQADDQAMLEMALVENIQRKDLNAIEISMSFQRLIEECNLTQEAMAERVGKNRATITNYLRLLKLPVEIQLALRQDFMSMGHARALLAVEDSARQLELADQILRKGLSVRQVEALVQTEKKPKPARKETDDLPESYFQLIEKIGQHFNNKISVKRTPQGSGSITIHIANDRQVEHFLRALESIKP
ncbi:MAG: ParB/RepB/Spo0J family partition protein [Bacteroidales bacterium]|nr:ParB/RepB/Spo0J family partition protein [Bacteroidales bacterium]MCL2738442.1 ParB/RepB/Spo0J family partition protein [Bacteroidales bacterium]